jgi:serine/threonine protein kinase
MVHHDFSPKNLVVVNGKLKLSDFNDAKLRRWNFDTDQACSGFNWDGLCGTSTERTHRRSPEECMGDDALRRGTDEKPEIYHLGCVLFVLLAGEEFPYYTEFSHSTGIRHKLTPSVARKHIITGKLPMLPPSVVEEERNGNVAVKAILHTMKWAFAFSPQDRPSAREVASFLSKAVTNLE